MALGNIVPYRVTDAARGKRFCNYARIADTSVFTCNHNSCRSCCVYLSRRPYSVRLPDSLFEPGTFSERATRLLVTTYVDAAIVIASACLGAFHGKSRTRSLFVDAVVL